MRSPRSHRPGLSSIDDDNWEEDSPAGPPASHRGRTVKYGHETYGEQQEQQQYSFDPYNVHYEPDNVARAPSSRRRSSRTGESSSDTGSAMSSRCVLYTSFDNDYYLYTFSQSCLVLTRVMTSTRARERKRRNGRRFCRLQVLELAKIVRQRSHTQMKEEEAVEGVAVKRVEKVIDLLVEKVNGGTMQLLATVDLLNEKPNDGIIDNQGGMPFMMIHIMIRKSMRRREWTIPMPPGEAERRAERKVDDAAIEKMTISIVRLRRIHHPMCLPVGK